MAYIDAKIHQIQFRLGVPPQTSIGELHSASPADSLAGFQAPTYTGGNGKGREGIGEMRKGKHERKGRDG